MRPRLLLIAFAPVLLAATGCGPVKINESRTLKLDAGTAAQSLKIPAPSKAIKLTVEFSSSSGDVACHVFKESDVPNEEAMTTVQPKQALGGKRGKGDTFTVDVPEGTATRVIVREHTAKETDVTVKVTSGP
jgi:hypothetical protein